MNILFLIGYLIYIFIMLQSPEINWYVYRSSVISSVITSILLDDWFKERTFLIK